MGADIVATAFFATVFFAATFLVANGLSQSWVMLLRLLVPYCFLGMLLSASWLGWTSGRWRLVSGAEWAVLILALLALRFRLPVVQRYAAAAGALLVLNAAAVVGLWRFLFSAGPLWKSWAVQGAKGGVPSHAEVEAREA